MSLAYVFYIIAILIVGIGIDVWRRHDDHKYTRQPIQMATKPKHKR